MSTTTAVDIQQCGCIHFLQSTETTEPTANRLPLTTVKPMDIEITKEWQKTVRPEIRGFFVQQVVKAIHENTRNIDDESKGLIALWAASYAINNEVHEFIASKSRSEYYQRIATKVDFIQKDMAKFRQNSSDLSNCRTLIALTNFIKAAQQ